MIKMVYRCAFAGQIATLSFDGAASITRHRENWPPAYVRVRQMRPEQTPVARPATALRRRGAHSARNRFPAARHAAEVGRRGRSARNEKTRSYSAAPAAAPFHETRYRLEAGCDAGGAP